MGICCSVGSPPPSPLPDPPLQIYSAIEKEKKKPREESLKKEVFVIKHRESHEIHRRSDEENPTQIPEPGKNTNTMNVGLGNGSGVVVGTQISTSSRTKEEIDAILIQCGRLSRSCTGKAAFSGSGGSCDNPSSSQRGRKYSASKRSFDFDGDKDCDEIVAVDGDEDESIADRIHRHRQRHRDSRSASSSPHGRRRTPSRERDPQQHQRSGSRERHGSGGGGRRVSRSPGRRSESPNPTSNDSISSGNANNSSNGRPVKMVSVPATVSKFALDRNNNGGGGGGGGGMVELPSAAAVQRVQVKRNVGAASPRSHSPSRTNALSCSNSRKTEQSPYRRNPLSDIDNNAATNNNSLHQAKTTTENLNNSKVVQGTDNSGVEEQQKEIVEEFKGLQQTTVTGIPSGTESLKPRALTRSRSSRLSRDLEINPETISNPNSSYTALLLEDIHKFHQKTTPAPTPTPAFSLPTCVTKACSIVEAVADMNSSTSTNLSYAFTEDRIRNPNKNEKNSHVANSISKKRVDTKEPIVESDIHVSDDLMKPSFHKYVTVRRGAAGDGGDIEDQESSGSNSFVGPDQLHWLSSSSWEPNSADSTDCYTSSRTYSRESDLSPLGFQRDAFSEPGYDKEEPQRRFSEKKRIADNQRSGIGHGRVGSGRGLYSMSNTVDAST